jgi:hypothetical protein
MTPGEALAPAKAMRSRRPPQITVAVIGRKPRQVGRGELLGEMREHGDRAETAEVEVEVGMDRHEVADIDAGGRAAFVEAGRRFQTGRSLSRAT